MIAILGYKETGVPTPLSPSYSLGLVYKIGIKCKSS